MTCKAYGCPCGEMSKRLCRYHLDADPKDWGFVSKKLNENQTLLKTIQWAMTEGRYKEDTLTPMLGETYLHLHPKDKESSVVWAYRALAWLSKEVKPVKYGEASIDALKRISDLREKIPYLRRYG